MDYASSRVLTSIHPNLLHLNIRTVSKIVATKLIQASQLQLHFNPQFCVLLGVAQHLNTHIALAYFVDDRYVEYYGVGLVQGDLISFAEVYQQLSQDFYTLVGDLFDF